MSRGFFALKRVSTFVTSPSLSPAGLERDICPGIFSLRNHIYWNRMQTVQHNSITTADKKQHWLIYKKYMCLSTYDIYVKEDILM